MLSENYIEPKTLEEAIELLEDSDLKVTSLNNKIIKLEEEKAEKIKEWVNISKRLAAEQERTSKLIDPSTYRKGWTSPEKYKEVKEKLKNLEAELKKLTEKKQPASASNDSTLQSELTAWTEAFENMTPAEAKDYWNLSGERMKGIISHYTETNERLLKESSEHKKMYNELRPLLLRANLNIESLEAKLAKYEAHDDSWISQVQIPHKNS